MCPPSAHPDLPGLPQPPPQRRPRLPRPLPRAPNGPPRTTKGSHIASQGPLEALQGSLKAPPSDFSGCRSDRDAPICPQAVSLTWQDSVWRWGEHSYMVLGGSLGVLGGVPGGPWGVLEGPWGGPGVIRGPSGGPWGSQRGSWGASGRPFGSYWSNTKSLKNHRFLLLFRNMVSQGGVRESFGTLRGSLRGVLWAQRSPGESRGGLGEELGGIREFRGHRVLTWRLLGLQSASP